MKRFFETRLRMDLRTNSPMVAIFFLGIFIEAGRYNHATQMFDEITKDEYFFKL